jgi:glutamate N-acetyltransferase/amino-acid N-acetyltransferase
VAAIKAAKPTKLVSPLAPARFPDLPVIEGAEFASGCGGDQISGPHRCDAGAAGAGHRDCRGLHAVLDPGGLRAGLSGQAGRQADQAGAAIIVNSGNANAFTGKGGQEAVDSVTGGVAKALGLPRERVFSSSTGVIGEPLPAQRITAIIGDLAGKLDPAGRRVRRAPS